MPRLPALALLLSSAALPALAQEAPPNPPVREVTLFEAGLAELTRETGDAGEVALRVPLSDVNDVLKSLLVRGTGIDTARMTLAGPDPIADAFAALPFPPEAATDLGLLLRTVPGLRVAISYPGEAAASEGVVVQVGENCTEAGGCRTEVTVLHDDGAIRRHLLGDGTDIAILDTEIADALRRGLAALRTASSGNAREVTVAMTGDAISGGALTYVVAAPAWKTAYRALIGDDGVDLQAWAVIENATGEDWDDVRLTLSSGSPRTLQADLFGRRWTQRDEFAPEAEYAVPIGRVAPAGGALDTMVADGFAMAAPQAPAPIVATAALSEGTIDSRFTFDAPVDLDAGDMLSMPFLAEALETEDIVLWQGQLRARTGNPDTLLSITNSLPVRLPAGIITVSDNDGGYIGDASVPVVAPGETRDVTYGQDRGIRIEENVQTTRQRLSVRLAQGAVRVHSEDRRSTTYDIIVHSGEARDVTIDHPLLPGWTATISAPAVTVAAERQDDYGSRWLRMDVAVPEMPEAGTEPDGDAIAATVTVADSYPLVETVLFNGLDADAFLYWSGEASSQDERAFLARAAELTGDVDAARKALSATDDELHRLTAEQTRIRDLLSALDSGTPAAARFLTQLLEAEDAIAAATATAATARIDVAAAQVALEAHLGSV